MRAMNQITQWFSVNQLAQTVQRVAAGMGIDVEIEHMQNPRVEREDDHYFNVVHTALPRPGP